MSGPFELIVNPTAGGGTAMQLLPTLEEELTALDVEWRTAMSRTPADPARLARRAADEGWVPVAVGGDGLVGTVADALAGQGAAMGIVAAGTANDFAAALGLPTGDASEAARVLATAKPRAVDLGLVVDGDGSRHFCSVAGAGFDAAVVVAAEGMRWPGGRLRYPGAVLRTFARSSPARFSLTVDDEPPREYDGWLVAVANSSRYGGGMQIAPQARVDDGLLDVTVIGPVGRLEFLRTFPRVFRGTHVRHPLVETLRVERVRIDCVGTVRWQADGELGGSLPVEISVVPGGMEVIVP